jgi:hypothetical protein
MDRFRWCVFLCVCGFIVAVFFGRQWDRESLELREAQCKLSLQRCRQDGYQQTTCQHRHAQCLQKLANDHPQFFKRVVSCGMFALFCCLLHCLADYEEHLMVLSFGVFQLYRAYPWGEQASFILAIEVLMLACRLFLGRANRYAALAQWCFVCMCLRSKDCFKYFMSQNPAHQVELVLFMLVAGYDGFNTMLRPRPVRDPPAAPAEQTRETARTKPPFELLTPSVKMHLVCDVWFDQ